MQKLITAEMQILKKVEMKKRKNVEYKKKMQKCRNVENYKYGNKGMQKCKKKNNNVDMRAFNEINANSAIKAIM